MYINSKLQKFIDLYKEKPLVHVDYHGNMTVDREELLKRHIARNKKD